MLVWQDVAFLGSVGNLPLICTQNYLRPFLSSVSAKIHQGVGDAGANGTSGSLGGETCKKVLTERYFGMDLSMLK